MRALRISIWALALALLLAFHYIGPFHPPHKQMAYPVNDDSVRVYPKDEFSGAKNHVVIQGSRQVGKSDLEQVQVCISAWYKNEQIRHYPRVNLIILLTTFFLQCVLWLTNKTFPPRA